jgi:type IV fimbrial biogenesis protein FimT
MSAVMAVRSGQQRIARKCRPPEHDLLPSGGPALPLVGCQMARVELENILGAMKLPPLRKRPACSSRPVSAGFTMVELLVVLAIMAVVAAMAGPSFSAMMNSYKQKSTASLIYTDLNLARNEAIKRNSRVLMCAAPGCGTSGATWQSGWLVCVEDKTTAGTCAASTSSAPNPLVIRPAPAAQVTLAAVNSSAAAVSNVRFNPGGTQGDGTLSVTFNVGGNWSGAVNAPVSVALTGVISK